MKKAPTGSSPGVQFLLTKKTNNVSISNSCINNFLVIGQLGDTGW